jgi:hypothetical protein
MMPHLLFLAWGRYGFGQLKSWATVSTKYQAAPGRRGLRSARRKPALTGRLPTKRPVVELNRKTGSDRADSIIVRHPQNDR